MPTKRTLLIVTCEKDLQSFGILLTSIKKYLDRCPIVIVWNQDDNVAILQNLLTKRDIDATVFLKSDFWGESAMSHLSHLEYDGWIDQQVIKIAVSKYIETPEYVCLDSKNFFIDKCNIDDIKQVHPASIDWCTDILLNWVDVCCKKFNVEPVKKLTQNTTPYVINTRLTRGLVKHFKSIDNFFVWFSTVSLQEDISPSEFFLYEIYTISRNKRNLGQTFSNQNTLWDHHWIRYRMSYDKMIKETENLKQLHDIRVSGVHAGLLKYRVMDVIYKHYKLI